MNYRGAVIAVLVLLSVGVIGVVTGRQAFRHAAPTRAQSQAESDIRNLSRADATEVERYAAMIRLAAGSDPRARTAALEAARSASVLLRRAAATALGYFDDPEALQSLRSLSEDSSPDVRRSAIFAWSNRPAQARAEVLEQLLERQGSRAMTDRERVVALFGLARIYDGLGPDIVAASPARSRAVTRLVRIAEESRDRTAAHDAWDKLLELPINISALSASVRKLTAANTFPDLAPRMFAALVRARDPWIASGLSGFLKSSSPEIRAAAVRSLPLICPKERLAYLGSALRNREDFGQQLAAVDSARLLGPEAAPLLEGLKKEKDLDPPVRNAIDSALKEIAGKPRGACDGR